MALDSDEVELPAISPILTNHDNPLYNNSMSVLSHLPVPGPDSLTMPNRTVEDIISAPSGDQLYDVRYFFILMGVLPIECILALFKPPVSKNFVPKREHGWRILLYLWLVMSFVCQIGITATEWKGWLYITSDSCLVIQPVVVAVTIYLGWKVYRSKVTLPEPAALEAVQYSVRAGWRIFWLMLSFQIIAIMYFFILNYSQEGQSIGDGLIFILLYSIIYIPSTFFLSGTSAMLIFQQRCSFSDMKSLQSKTQNQTARLSDFIETKNALEEREKITPLNIVLGTAALNTAMSVIVVLATDNESSEKIAGNILFSLGLLGRQIVALLWLLVECMEINEIPDLVMEDMVLNEWKDDAERHRISVHTAFRCIPIGSQIFFYRPSRTEIMVQIVGTVGGVVFSVLYKLLLSVQGTE